LALRKAASSSGFEIRTARGVPERRVIGQKTLREMLGSIPLPRRSAFVRWLASAGPFWEDDERHPGDAWLETREELITDTGLGEAAYRVLNSRVAASVSVVPSEWNSPSIEVRFVEDGSTSHISIENFTDEKSLVRWSERNEPPLANWLDLIPWCGRRCSGIRIARSAPSSLNGIPFIAASAERIQELLLVLNTLAVETTKEGMTAAGQAMYQAHFARKNAHFSDSSDTEKAEFRSELTFPDPRKSDQTVFATWHGKIRTGVLRLHYIHEFIAGEPVHVVYIGPKITKR